MEIIVGLVVVIGAAAYFATRKKDLAEANESAPYKTETPVPAADVAPQPVVVAVEGAGAVEVPAKPAKAKKATAAKKPAAAKKAPAKKPAAKPAAKKAPAKKKPSA